MHPMSAALYRRCLRSCAALSKHRVKTAELPEEALARGTYYRRWAREHLLAHADASPSAVPAVVQRGEEKRLWILAKYKCADTLGAWEVLGGNQEVGPAGGDRGGGGGSSSAWSPGGGLGGSVGGSGSTSESTAAWTPS